MGEPTVQTSGKNDPAATDLDYYSKPENYEGSNLQSFKKFQVAKDKEDKSKQVRGQGFVVNFIKILLK